MKPFTAVVAMLAVGVALGAGADAAAAKPRGHKVSAITAALRTHDIYIERGTRLRPATRRKLVASARKHHLRLVILRRLPRGAKTLAGAAMQIAARLDDGIVAVAMRGRKIATAPLASATVAHARTRIGKRRGAAALLAFARAVHPASGAAARAHPASAGGSGGILPTWGWLLGGGGLAVFGISLLALRPARRTRRTPEAVADGMELLRRRAANLSKAVQFEGESAGERADAIAQKLLDRAGEIATDVRATLLRTQGPPQQRKAHSRLDEAEWHLECARAELDGVTPPQRPGPGQPALCFFDGDHGLGTIEVDLDLQGKPFPVCVCIADALRLSRYEEPLVGFVKFGGETLPWPSAPTWLGSRGFPQSDLRELYHGGQPLFREIKPEVHGHGLGVGLEIAPSSQGALADLSP